MVYCSKLFGIEKSVPTTAVIPRNTPNCGGVLVEQSARNDNNIATPAVTILPIRFGADDYNYLFEDNMPERSPPISVSYGTQVYSVLLTSAVKLYTYYCNGRGLGRLRHNIVMVYVVYGTINNYICGIRGRVWLLSIYVIIIDSLN